MSQPSRRRVRPGFTLVELLTVMGIIVVLIGILLPVIAAVRRSAYGTDSQAAVLNLGQAIERYRQDFNAFPGIYSNDQIAARVILPAAGANPVTPTENMVLSLLGGLEPGATPPGSIALDFTKIGGGPMSMNPIITARKRYPSYVDAVPGTTIQSMPWQPTMGGPVGVIKSDVHGYDSRDTMIPEFIDRFPDPLPIIYLRANVGRPNPPTATNTTAALNNTAPYNYSGLLAYVRVSANGTRVDFPSSSEDLNNNTVLDSDEDLDGNGALTPDFPDPGSNVPLPAAYFRNPQVGVDTNRATWQPRQKDAFIVIGAGPDRKYGTKDDQTNFGSLQQ